MFCCAVSHSPDQTLRRFGGRQPLCGIGVTSRIAFTSRPAAARARIADSRPEPGPATRTSTARMPWSRAIEAAFDAACWAANGVPLRDPRKPSEPELFQLTVLPCVSAMVTMVLLNVAWMCTIPNGTFFFSLRLKVLPERFPFFPASAAAAAGFAMVLYFQLPSRQLLYRSLLNSTSWPLP